MSTVYQATASAPYWGKRDVQRILPTNSSLSPGGRTAVCIEELRRLRKVVEMPIPNETKISQYKLHIASYNNFPTAAGLASSAAGFAALVSSIAYLYSLQKVLSPSELSMIARQGSGSALVAWQADSVALEVAPRDHWPQMHALICVVSDAKKGTSSTSGMQRTRRAPAHGDITDAIKGRDFARFAQITMQDSNSFHAVCLDTEPPIFYMNDVSKALVALVVEYNRACGETRAAYTFDAGPNAVIYLLEPHVREVANLVARLFPLSDAFKDPFGLFTAAGDSALGAGTLPVGFNEGVVASFGKGAVKGLIHTRVGDGPRHLMADSVHLLDATGQPKPVPSAKS
ncbi:Diphosphomevalonate decarboxylase [Auriculariales sp. MPI-PUGE-AT-0066]|nr:Diphosphomevalonate decarboxylase [Auriculariales sp. MPI-PUGE-AT-0066]